MPSLLSNSFSMVCTYGVNGVFAVAGRQDISQQKGRPLGLVALEYRHKDGQTLVREVGRVVLGPVLGEVLEQLVRYAGQPRLVRSDEGAYPGVEAPGHPKVAEVQRDVNITGLCAVIHGLLQPLHIGLGEAGVEEATAIAAAVAVLVQLLGLFRLSVSAAAATAAALTMQFAIAVGHAFRQDLLE